MRQSLPEPWEQDEDEEYKPSLFSSYLLFGSILTGGLLACWLIVTGASAVVKLLLT